jgi:hypothetical protein
VVDGRARGACLEAALAHLAADGIVVFDNSARKRYRRAIENSRLAYREFRGLTACLPYPDSTTLLSRDPSMLTGLPDPRGAWPMRGVSSS